MLGRAGAEGLMTVMAVARLGVLDLASGGAGGRSGGLGGGGVEAKSKNFMRVDVYRRACDARPRDALRAPEIFGRSHALLRDAAKKPLR
jgi:hypothetical protein